MELEPSGEAPFRIEIVRSTRRRRTVSARLRGDVLLVRVPTGLSELEERDYVERLSRQITRRNSSATVDVAAAAHALARRFDLPKPVTVRWVGNQSDRWGSCTPSNGELRISDRLAGYPRWVLDYVLVHELAHLVEANHSAAFWSLVNRYPKAERARGFLMAKGLEDES